jgi:peptidoglycan L-alanyl-D-glutamate endopeptidase CwlK
MIDQRSAKNIATLHPQVAKLATELIEQAAAAGISVKVISGLRTYAEQDALYAQGRTKPGEIVTKAKGGYSIHNFGCAFDVGIFSKDGKKYYGEHADYARVGKLGEMLGLEWGGRWTSFVDEPHFQLTKGKSLADMRSAKAAGKDVLV